VDHYGYSREAFLGLNVRDLWEPGADARYEENIRDREQEQTLHLQRRHRTRDGRAIDVELTARRFLLSGRQAWLTVAHDVSERLRTEAAVRESEARFRATIESAPVGIMHTAIEDDRILQVNPQLCALVGYSAEELVGMTTDDILHSSHRGADRGKYRDRMLRGELNSFSSERTLVRKDGSLISVNRTVSLVRDDAGQPLYFIRILEDITERTQSARRRAMEHAVTSVLAEASTVGEALPTVIRAICEGLDWDCGFHWGWERSAELLLCRENWHRGSGAIEEFMQASRDMVNPAPVVAPQGTVGGGLVRRVWASGAPVWIPDVAEVADFRRAQPAASADIHGAFAFPIVAEGRPVGIMEFFSHAVRQPQQELLQIAQAIGSQIGQFIQRKQTEAALRQSEVQFRQLANNIPQVFWITDVKQKETLYLSPAAETLIGQPLHSIRDHVRVLVRAVHPEDRSRVYAARRAATAGGYDETYRIVRSDGSIRWVHDRAFPVHDASGTVYRIAGIAEDITERKLAEERLMHLAHYDVLTSLPNRVLYYDRLRQALAQRNQWTVGVMLIDVDRFKNVNDTLGHAVGDRLLQQVSERLTRSVRSGDTVGRLGGDEFAVVLSNLATAQDANLVAQKIIASFKEPFRLDGGAEIYVTGSIGITLYPNDSTDQDTLIKNADAAMYRAKEVGRNAYRFYTPEMNARALELLSMESSLRRALDRREFLLYYQPKVSVASGDIVGVEALLRWRHPERGLVSPGEFMPVLEDTGLIVPVGEWVVGAVCAQINEWQGRGIDPKAVAVNLSARQFVDKELGATIRRILEENGVDPTLIELEITESSLMANTEESTRTLEFLAQLGVGLSIDDFGTGYSSLGYLKRFPLDALKVDRSFVRDITTSADDATITRAVISMAHSLGLKVIAEGVETQEQVSFLAEHGCDEFQGYFFSRPLPADECGAWLRERRALARPAVAADAPTVLLVDDDHDALTLTRRALAKDAYQVLTAYSVQQGLELLGRQPVDLVIADQNLPGTVGIDFLRRVRAASPGTMRILTGSTEPLDVPAAVVGGDIFRFLPKGSSEERLRADVRDALQCKSG
jgi:diguanylate cyclase (GGDEF)-like protein/PAS domain S-box-containing protein